MNSTNSLDMLRYGANWAASRYLGGIDASDSFIRGYELDGISGVPAQVKAETLYEAVGTPTTSYIQPICHGRAAHVAYSGALATIIGSVAVDPECWNERLTGTHVDVIGHSYLLALAAFETFVAREGAEFTCYAPEHDPLLASAIERLESFRKLGPNWNGYDGVAPTKRAIDECLAFAMSLPPLARGPVAEVSGKGEVGLLWERDEDDALVEVGFLGDGTYGYLAIRPNGVSHELEGTPVGTALPDDLSSALRVFLKG